MILNNPAAPVIIRQARHDNDIEGAYGEQILHNGHTNLIAVHFFSPGTVEYSPP